MLGDADLERLHLLVGRCLDQVGLRDFQAHVAHLLRYDGKRLRDAEGVATAEVVAAQVADAAVDDGLRGVRRSASKRSARSYGSSTSRTSPPLPATV